MFLRCSTRKKNGKAHRYWSIVENRRVAGGRVLQRHVLYLGEISGSQQEAWQKSIEVFEDGQPHPKTVALLPEEEFAAAASPQEQPGEENIVRIRLSEMALRRPRQWGACWLACHLYEQLELDRFFAGRLLPSRKGTRWDLVLQTLCAYRLIDPGSEWRLHREGSPTHRPPLFPSASSVVRAQRDGRSARGGFCARRNSQALRLPRASAGAQSRALHAPATALEGSLQRAL